MKLLVSVWKTVVELESLAIQDPCVGYILRDADSVAVICGVDLFLAVHFRGVLLALDLSSIGIRAFCRIHMYKHCSICTL